MHGLKSACSGDIVDQIPKAGGGQRIIFNICIRSGSAQLGALFGVLPLDELSQAMCRDDVHVARSSIRIAILRRAGVE
jgi:hypothetical protein